jgi:hypothetical protein
MFSRQPGKRQSTAQPARVSRDPAQYAHAYQMRPANLLIRSSLSTASLWQRRHGEPTIGSLSSPKLVPPLCRSIRLCDWTCGGKHHDHCAVLHGHHVGRTVGSRPLAIIRRIVTRGCPFRLERSQHPCQFDPELQR